MNTTSSTEHDLYQFIIHVINNNPSNKAEIEHGNSILRTILEENDYDYVSSVKEFIRSYCIEDNEFMEKLDDLRYPMKSFIRPRFREGQTVSSGIMMSLKKGHMYQMSLKKTAFMKELLEKIGVTYDENCLMIPHHFQKIVLGWD